jgi:hypothetical protein
LPGVKELLSLVDTMALGIPIDLSAFPGTPRDVFWTSSPVAGTPGSAWGIDFRYAVNADTTAAATTDLRQVRCVRSQ